MVPKNCFTQKEVGDDMVKKFKVKINLHLTEMLFKSIKDRLTYW